MTDHTLPHDPYITAVYDALTAAGLEPTEAWTEDTELDRYRAAWQSARFRAQAYGEGILRVVKDRESYQEWLKQAEARITELESPAVVALEHAFVAELNDSTALTMLDALIVLRSKLPCTCARSQGLHEKHCRRFVPGHELISPARRLARAREEMRHLAASEASSASVASVPAPAATESAADELGTRPCGHDDYHDPHEWADRPGTWCAGHGYADDEPTP